MKISVRTFGASLLIALCLVACGKKEPAPGEEATTGDAAKG